MVKVHCHDQINYSKAIAYCLRRQLFTLREQLLAITQDGSYTHSREMVRSLVTFETAKSLTSTLGDARCLYDLVHESKSTERQWRSNIEQFMATTFDWSTSPFYNADLDDAGSTVISARCQLLTWAIEHGANLSDEANTSTRGSLLSSLCATVSGLSFGPIHTILLSGGADPDQVNAHGMTPLQMSAARGHVPLVKILLEAGANADFRGDVNLTPLHHVANCTRVNAATVVSLLVGAGADPSAADADGMTPLHYAATRGYLPVVRALLQNGALRPRPEPSVVSPLMLAIARNHIDVVQVMLEEYHVSANQKIHANDPRCPRTTPLHIAIDTKHFDIAQALVKFGANVNARDANGHTALTYAIRDSNIADVRFLLSNGARLGTTSLHLACSVGDFEIFSTLLFKCTPIEELDDQGRTPLLIAAARGRKEICDDLIMAGANVNHKDFQGYSALDMAKQNCHRAVVSFLKSKGAKRSLRSLKRRFLYRRSAQIQPVS